MNEPPDFHGSEAEAESQDADISDAFSDTEAARQNEPVVQQLIRGSAGGRGRPSTSEGPRSRTDCWKRSSQFYNDKYVDLVKQEEGHEEPFGREHEFEVEFSGPSQYGTVLWDPREKAAFFKALCRKGRHDVTAIANETGSKSETEVIAYLNLLQDRAGGQHLYQADTRAPALADIPAAAEIGKITEAMLDKHAEALRMYQDSVDTLIGQQQHPDTWLIHTEKAEALDSLVGSMEDLSGEPELPVPEAELFRLKDWVELSRNIFMNSGVSEGENNWRNIAFDDESPALALEAVEEFHELAISMTRRLIQTSMILAESRIRATTYGSSEPRRIVKEQDVSAALQILRMPQNSWKFWLQAPRRCSLKMRYSNQAKDKNSETNYDEIERILHEKTFKTRGRSSSVSTDITQSSDDTNDMSTDRGGDNVSIATEQSHENVALQSDSSDEAVGDDIEDNLSTDSGAEQPMSPSEESESDELEDYLYYKKYSTDREVRQMHLEQQRHLYAELVDKANGQAEEVRLWKLLARKVPEGINEAPTAPLNRGPFSLRKSRYDLMDWKDTVSRRRGWQEYADGENDGAPSGIEAKKQRRSSSEQSTRSSMDIASEA